MAFCMGDFIIGLVCRAIAGAKFKAMAAYNFYLKAVTGNCK